MYEQSSVQKVGDSVRVEPEEGDAFEVHRVQRGGKVGNTLAFSSFLRVNFFAGKYSFTAFDMHAQDVCEIFPPFLRKPTQCYRSLITAQGSSSGTPSWIYGGISKI